MGVNTPSVTPTPLFTTFPFHCLPFPDCDLISIWMREHSLPKQWALSELRWRTHCLKEMHCCWVSVVSPVTSTSPFPWPYRRENRSSTCHPLHSPPASWPMMRQLSVTHHPVESGWTSNPVSSMGFNSVLKHSWTGWWDAGGQKLCGRVLVTLPRGQLYQDSVCPLVSFLSVNWGRKVVQVEYLCPWL